jgi:hypothetical protein
MTIEVTSLFGDAQSNLQSNTPASVLTAPDPRFTATGPVPDPAITDPAAKASYRARP